GRSAEGTSLQLVGGSWDLRHGAFQQGIVGERWDGYFGLSAGERGDYESGEGNTMVNTRWDRWGAAGAVGVQLDDEHRLDFGLRVDGIYDAGFRGSGGNVHSRDDRFNRNADLRYEGTAGRF